MPDDYLKRVSESYQGEVYGEALFHGLAARVEDPGERHKWRVLQQLEAETKMRLKPLVSALGGETREESAGLDRGERHAASWSKQSWAELMEMFRAELPKYVRFFEKLEADARPEDAELLRCVTAHERALEEFAARELSGQSDDSLQPVLALLDHPPQAE